MNPSEPAARLAPHLRWLLVAVVLGAAVAIPTEPTAASAQTGSWTLQSLFVRVDDGTDPESATCAGTIRRDLRRANIDNVNVQSIPRNELMRRLGVTSMDGFVAWPRERFAGVLNLPPHDQSVVTLLDCRPSARSLDLIVFSGRRALNTVEPQRLSVRDTDITHGLAGLIGTLTVEWHGYTH